MPEVFLDRDREQCVDIVYVVGWFAGGAEHSSFEASADRCGATEAKVSMSCCLSVALSENRSRWTDRRADVDCQIVSEPLPFIEIWRFKTLEGAVWYLSPD